MPRQPAKARPDTQGAVEDLIPRPTLLPDEDPTTYDHLHQALLLDLNPATPYEKAIAENLVTNEWEALRHRRLRDALIRAKARDVAVGLCSKGKLTELNHWEQPEEEAWAVGVALIGDEPDERQDAFAALRAYDIGPDEVMAEAYRLAANAVEVHEQKLADLETRRRRLRDDYDRLKSARARPVEDAEVVRDN